MAAGSLVVKLGLDAAEYTKGLSRAEYQARQFGETIGTGIRNGALASTAALVSLGGAALAANAAFNKLLDGAAKFQDLSEETGASAAGIAGLAVAAGTAGVQIESVAGSMNKLTKNLVGVDDEGKAAGAALAALGVNVKDFKALDPVAQYEAISKALAKFEDGAGKTAVAMALFGKSGAEQLKVLKALEEQGGRVNILTDEQIARADEYRDAQAKLTAEIGLYASAVATEFIGPTNELKKLALEAAKELFGLSGEVTSLGRNNGVRDFAENAAVALVSLTERIGTVLSALVTVGRTAQVVGSNLRLGFEIASTPVTGVAALARGEDPLGRVKDAYAGNNEAIEKLSKSYQDTIDRAKGQESKKLQKLFTDRRQDEALNAYYGISNQKPPPKPKLAYDGAEPKGKKPKDTAAQEAKAQLGYDLDAIKNAQEAVTNTYANQEKILEALRSAGLKEEGAYYQEKARLISATSAAQEDALQKQIARMQQENLTGKDAIDNAKKIADAEAALAKIRENSATQAQVLAIQQKAAYDKMAASILSAKQAAQDFFDTTNRGYAREIAGIGKGNKNRNFDSGITQIEDKYRQQRQDLQNQRAQAELNGSFGPEAQKQYDSQLGIINDFQTKAIDSYKNYYDTITEAQSNWLNGATEALHNYSDEAANVAKHTEEAFTNAFKGLEDQFTNLLSGKKFDGKKLLADIGGDLTRNFVKENITGPLAKFAGDAIGDGGLLSGLFGGGSKKSSNGNLPNSATASASALDELTAAVKRASGAMGGGLGGGGGLLGSLTSGSGGSSGGGWMGLLGAAIGAVSGTGGLVTAANALPGDALDNLFRLGIGRASGGSVSPYSVHRVNENGPELLDVNGKQFLMNGSRNARVTANSKLGGEMNYSPTFILDQPASRKTQEQVAAKALMGAQRGLARQS